MEGASPSFLFMISEQDIHELLKAKFEDTDYFLVDLNIDSHNNIRVAVDTPSGISVEGCKEINRFLERNLDREEDDFALIVSSPDLSKPLKVHKQYIKNIGRDLEVTTNDKEITGTLTKVTDSEIELEYEEVTKEGKKKVKTIKQEVIAMDAIKKAKVVISFKKNRN